MPRRDDINKILIIGSGPIVIGQACEFDYSGTQACKALREEGYQVVLVNSNPATIMTDPDTADATYSEPLTWQMIEKIIAKEKPDALLPTLGGQTGLNCAMDLEANGVLEKYGVEMIGANAAVIAKAEEREQFKAAMEKIGLDTCKGHTVKTLEHAREALQDVGLPAVVRPSFTMGGSGSAIAYNKDEFDSLVQNGLDQSPVTEVLIEESIIGWKEYEMEVVRDKEDNVVIICSIENFDAMGVHTGDSITVAPAQTLTDKEYQRMRDASLAVIREIGVETGGSNIQFAIEPDTGRMIVIEMNPRVSRSSALASKATGFPIAKIAAKLAIGYLLWELPNDITKQTKACFEPTIDYVVTKMPRFAFEKFPEADATLTTQMKSVGETMAIGRTFRESMQKALRGLEVGAFGLGSDNRDQWATEQQPDLDEIRAKLSTPGAERIFYIRYALKAGMSIDEVFGLTNIDLWFLDHLSQIVEHENRLIEIGSLDGFTRDLMWEAKRDGFSDRQIAKIVSATETQVRARRLELGVKPVYKSVDTCAAEFEAYTPYYYSTYEVEDELPPKSDKKRVVILGGGPNRIGQGIEFDYCCCHASFALRDIGIESVMVNSNPETVSTDYDTSDMLFFEPLTIEDVLNICDAIQPDGVIVQFGGQTPLNLARGLAEAGVPVIGTSVDTIEAAEDRELFQQLIDELGLKQPPSGIARNMEEARVEAKVIGFPMLVRPSFVLGGRAMEICYDQAQFDRYVAEAFVVADGQPVLIDRFLEDATEVDVDAIAEQTLSELLLAPELSEPTVARVVADAAPSNARVVVSSSMPVRDLEWFGGRRAAAHSNRGANGIDGVMSTSLGLALTGVPVIAVIGDLAFVHDSNALWGIGAHDVDLRIIVIDNDGGGIFSFLPQASELPSAEFERLFGTPHGTDLCAVATAHGVEAVSVQDRDELIRELAVPGPRVIRVPSNRRRNVAVHELLVDEVRKAIG